MSPSVPEVRRESGLTLLEVLVVIAIVGVLIAAGAGRRQRDGDGPTLRAAEAEVMTLLTLARTNALRLNRATRLLVELEPAADGGGQRLFILSLNPDDGIWSSLGPLHRLGTHALVVSDALLHAGPVDGGGEGMASTFHGKTNAGWAGETSYECGYIHFSSTGTSFGTVQLVVAPARALAEAWAIIAPQRARRLLVRPGGAVTVRRASPQP